MEKNPDCKLVSVPHQTYLEKMLKSSREYVFKSEDGYVKGYQFENQLINQLITPNRLRTLTNETPLFIASQTGSGKSTLVMNQVLSLVKSRQQKLLILSSRTALADQYRREAALVENPDLLKDLTPSGLRKQKDFGMVTIFTYQEFFFYMRKNCHQSFTQYGAVVLDECHFFVQDAAFNEYTQSLLKSLVHCFHHCLRFYLSATPDICLDEIIYVEKKHQYKKMYFDNPWNNNFYYPVPNNTFSLYYFANNYSYIEPCFFKNNQDIVNIIKSDTSAYKYLICVDTREQGKLLQKALGDSICEYIDAELKKSTMENTVTAIINDRKFDKKVLIATSFLDVGINLIDCNLTNIVIYSTDKTHFIQSIGRKRKLPQEKVTLYIHIPELEHVKRMLKNAQMLYREMAQNKSEYISKQQKVISSLSFPFYLETSYDTLKIQYNGYTFTFWESRIKSLEAMLSSIMENQEYEEAIAKHYLGWLELEEIYDKCHWLGNPPCIKNVEMIDFFDAYANQDLTEEIFSSFKDALLAKHNCVYPEAKLRKDRKLHINALNKYFDDKNLSYRIKKVSNTPKIYRIVKG